MSMVGIARTLFDLAACDAAFRRRLIDDPNAVLAEHGLDVPADVEISIEELDDGTLDFCYTIPDELDDELLDSVAGGAAGGNGALAAFQAEWRAASLAGGG